MASGAPVKMERGSRSLFAARVLLGVVLVLPVLFWMGLGRTMRSNEAMSVEFPLRTLAVVIDDNYPPYVFRDETGTLRGYLVDLWALWSRKTSIPVELIATNWSVAQQLLLSGQADVIDTLFETPDRRQRYRFLLPYAQIEVPLFVHRDIGGVSGPADLGGFVVGAKAGDAAVEWLRSRGVTRIELSPSCESVLAAATAGVIRVFTVDRPPAMFYLTRWHCVEQFRIGFVMYTGQFHRAVRADNAELGTIVQAGFARISKAEDAVLRARWFGRPLIVDRWTRLAVTALVLISILAALLVVILGILRKMVRERTRALEQALQAREATADRLRGTLAAAPVGIGVVRRRVFQEVNDHLCEMMGYSREQLIGRSPRLLYLDDAEFERVARLTSADIRQTGHASAETRWRRADGELRDIWLSLVALHDSGDGDSVLFSALDITDRKRIERELMAREAELSALVHNLAGAVYRGRPDQSGGLQFLSDGIKSITGRAAADFLAPSGPPLDSVILPSERLRVEQERAQALRERGVWEGEYPVRTVTGDGETRWVWERSRVLPGETQVGVWQGYLADVTSLQRANERLVELERELQQAQKLESLGLLASKIAHDFNNVLTAVLGHVSLAADALPASSAVRLDLLAAERAVRQATDLTQRLLAYAGRAPANPRPVNVSEIVLDLQPMLRISIRPNIELHLQCAHDLPAIRGDPAQIQHLVMNLVTNAAEAIGERPGSISITTEAREFDRAELRKYRLQEDRLEGTYVVLEVADTGCGLSPGQVARLFEPFFSTKSVGRGLGLCTVLAIVRAHHGLIGVESEPGLGSIFRVLFPLLIGPAPSTEEALPSVTDWKGHGAVLVADDEEVVRNVSCRLLSRLGFEVLTAADGQEAIRLFREHHERLRAVVLDLTMPYLDGVETCRQLLAISRRVPVLLASGYDKGDMRRRYAGVGFADFVQKPFSLDELRRMFRLILTS